jgi:hypothetical protein
MTKETNPAHMRNRPVESDMGEPGFTNEANARNSLRNASMYGDKDGTTAKAVKQFPHLAKEHSGVHREVAGKQMKTISEHLREAQGKKLGPVNAPPAQNNETMGAQAGAPPESTGQMDGTDVSEDGDESFLNA